MSDQSGLQRASIETESGIDFVVSFNPEQFTITKTNNWQADTSRGRATPDLSFAGGESGTMSFTLHFDNTADGTSITTQTDELAKMMEVDKTLASYDSGTQTGRPPWVQFHWGDLHSFKATITSMTLSYTYFASDGTPLRGKADLQLKQFDGADSFAPQNPTSGTPNPERTHQVQAGETLDRISATYYGDSTRWRRIADANGIGDPLAVAPGTVITIPKLRD